MGTETTKKSDEGEYIFRASTTLPDGTVIYARDYCLKAFKIPVSKG